MVHIDWLRWSILVATVWLVAVAVGGVVYAVSDPWPPVIFWWRLNMYAGWLPALAIVGAGAAIEVALRRKTAR
jgi:hypothetical protein